MPKKKESTFEPHKTEDGEDILADEESVHPHNAPADQPEEIEHKMSVGDLDADVETPEGREELVEEDEIAAWEEGFSEGEEKKKE
jgi:hypothetical protein